MSKTNVRQSENDRRSKTSPTDVKQKYKGSERRSGEKRRKWIDRIQELHEKLK